jgi:hypothetical protein
MEQFDPNNTVFSEYKERLDYYFIANDIEDDEPDKKKAVFLTIIGPKQYSLLRDLCAPQKIADKTYEELCKLMQNHHEPVPPMYLQRTKFESRIRKPGESVQQFVAAIREISEHCNFGDTLEERLCERIVRGINDEHIQRQLLREKDLNLQKAIDIAQSTAITAQGAKEIINSESHASGSNINVLRNKSFKPQKQFQSHSKVCMRCGKDHKGVQCKFKDSECYKCGKTGHIQAVCRSKEKHQNTQGKYQNKDKPNKKQTGRNQFLNENSDDTYDLFSLGKSTDSVIWVDLEIQGKKIKFQLDTGASFTVMTKEIYDELFPEIPIKHTETKLSTYTGEEVEIFGQIEVNVKYEHQNVSLPLLIVRGNGPALMGRDWLQCIKLQWPKLLHLNSELGTLLEKYDEVFSNEAGSLKDVAIKIHVKHNTTPIFKKARHPPFALRKKIEHELERLQKSQIIEKVDSSEWATPIVPIVKRDNTIRLCGDYKVTLNKVVKRDEHPIPKIEELVMKLSNGEKYSSIDFSHAYTQLKLESESQELTTINTHIGLFKYLRLPYGISSGAALFQRNIEATFKDIPNTCIYFDNMYITGKNDEEHLKTLEEVLKVCIKKGLTIKRAKCEFLQESVDFLGFKLNKDGLMPQEEKIKAIKEAPAPSNTQELKAYLGLLNYYSKYCYNISHQLSPLYDLLKKDRKWFWGPREKSAFENSKEILSSEKLLVHYQPSLPITLTCDASPRGVSAVMSHIMPNGSERPIMYASRSLSIAERNYSQNDREGLAVVFGVKKFHKFLYGLHFTIKTDNKPLIGLFGENKQIPEHASPRIQRWVVLLQGYDYTMVHIPGVNNVADAFSRLPLPEKPRNVPIPADISMLFSLVDNTPITSTIIANETQLDERLKQVYMFCANGWPNTVTDDLIPYHRRRNELSIENNCVLWGSRVIIPLKLQKNMLNLLHEDHVGIVRMKAFARGYI